MSASVEQFHKETEVVLRLVSEIHDICMDNNIKYYLADDLFLLAYNKIKEEEEEEESEEKDDDNAESVPVIKAFSDDNDDSNEVEQSEIDIRSGMIYMHPDDFQVFTKAVSKINQEDRALEWIETNPDFPGLYARYVDTSTVYYSALRLCTEKQMGMSITINILRPRGSSLTRDKLRERVWRDWSMGLRPIRKKIKYSFSVLDAKASMFGKEKVAKQYADKLLSYYASLRKKNGSEGDVWILKDTKIRPYIYPASLFAEDTMVNLHGYTFITVKDQEKYSYSARKRNVSLKDNIYSFCDTEIPFRELNLENYKEMAESFIKFRQDFVMNPKFRRNKKKWRSLLRTLSRTYYRYYYGTMLLDHVDEYEEMLRLGKKAKLREELDPYKSAIMKYGCVYLNDRMSDLMIELYGDVIIRKMEDRPELFDEGIKIYDYKGNYQRTIGGKDV